MTELVQHHRARMRDPGLEVDDPRLPRVHAPRRTSADPGHPVSRSVTVPVTVGTSEALAHACHCPLSRPPVGAHQPHRPRAANRRRHRRTQKRQAKDRAQACQHDDRERPVAAPRVFVPQPGAPARDRHG